MLPAARQTLPEQTASARPVPWLKAVLPFLLLTAAMLALASGGLAFIRHDAARHMAEEEAANAKLATAAAQAVRQRTERSLEAITSLHSLGKLALLGRNAEPQRDVSTILDHLQDWADTRRFGVLQVAFINRQGHLAWTTAAGFGTITAVLDLSDREHFRVHRDGRLEPFVSAPLVGRASGAWSLQVTRPVLDHTGAFAGVVVVSIDPLLMARELRELDFAAGAAATLLRRDGSILSRSEDLERLLGQRVPVEILAQMTDGEGGVFKTISPVTEQNVLVAWRSIPGWPLLVTFALDQEPTIAALAERQRILWAVLLSVLGVVGTAGLLAITWLSRKHVRAQAERAQASRREVVGLLEALPGVAYRGMVDAQGDYRRMYIGSNIARMTGWSLERFQKLDFYRGLLRYDEGAERREDFFRRVFAAGEAACEYRLRTADDQFLWLRDHCRLVQRYADGTAEVVGLLTDITEEQQIRAQAFASAKLATLGEMATGVAHELNQPCASIALAADVAAAELDHGGEAQRQSARRRLDVIAAQTTRLRDVVDHFRIFGRTEDVGNGAIHLASAVVGALTIGGGMLNAAGIRAVVDVPGELPPVRAQLVPLEQVLVNLLVNARDAMRTKGQSNPSIEITGRHDADQQEVVLTVRDHGCGLPPAQLSRVFEPFYTTKPIGEGTGLGLAIAYGTIRGFGGSIAIGNHPDGGAIVTIRLKEAAAAVAPLPPATATSA